MVKKVAATVLFAAALAASAFAAAAGGGGSLHAGGVCSPGQHGNSHPGFKPGSCDNK
jgi:hypothetical protein